MVINEGIQGDQRSSILVQDSALTSFIPVKEEPTDSAHLIFYPRLSARTKLVKLVDTPPSSR